MKSANEDELNQKLTNSYIERKILVPAVLSYKQELSKRTFDLILAISVIFFLWWLIIIGWIIASIDTREGGFFIQKRVGRYGRIFNVFKLRTMRSNNSVRTTVTTHDDSRITFSGRILRKFKIDELPQLFNVFLGDMSFVGPRPDVPGYADILDDDDRIILSIRPGITGPATLKYRNEEALLAREADPEAYNRQVIWPDKVRINKSYVINWSLKRDVYYIVLTVFTRKLC